jgi:hypothetical protein
MADKSDQQNAPSEQASGQQDSTEKTVSVGGEAAAENGGSQATHRSLKIHLYLFCGMLVLALIGMGVTESREDGGWEYWIFLVLIYGLVSVVLAWRRAKRKGESAWRMIHKHVLHWIGALITLKILFLLEKTDIMSREAVSDVSVIILALSCYLAGVHLQWMFLLLGIFVGIMAITLAYTEQYIIWLIMIPVAVGATWLYVKLRFARGR